MNTYNFLQLLTWYLYQYKYYHYTNLTLTYYNTSVIPETKNKQEI